MAAPNIVGVSTIYGRCKGVGLTTITSGIVTCSAEHVYKINSVIVSNTHGTLNAGVSVGFFDASSATTYQIADNVTVPANSTLVIIGKDSPIYLEESDEIRAGTATTITADLVVSYESLTDA